MQAGTLQLFTHEALNAMVHDLEKRQPWFKPGNTSAEGNLCYLLKPDSWHTCDGSTTSHHGSLADP